MYDTVTLKQYVADMASAIEDDAAGKDALIVLVDGTLQSAILAKLCEKTGLKTFCVTLPDGEVDSRVWNMCVGNEFYPVGDRRRAGIKNGKFIRAELHMMGDVIHYWNSSLDAEAQIDMRTGGGIRRANAIADALRAAFIADFASVCNAYVPPPSMIADMSAQFKEIADLLLVPEEIINGI